MTAPLRLLERGSWAGLLACAAFVFMIAGCQSDRGPGRQGGWNGRPMQPVTPMAGSEAFFDGRLVAEVKVGPLPLAQSDQGGGEADGKGGGKGRGLTGNVQADGSNRGTNIGGGLGYDFGGASVGLGLGGGGANVGLGLGGGGGAGPSGGGPPREGEGGGGGRGAPPGGMGSIGPLAIIRLRFTNQGKDRLEFRIVDFLSPIGNFVVQPEKLALDPGQWAETEPMSSQLVGSLTEADIRLVLRTPDKTETKTIMLHATSVPAAGASQKPGQPSSDVPEGAPPPPPGP